MLKQGLRLNMLILDEPFTSLDSENLEEAIKLLRYLLKNYKSILIITHQDQLKQESNNIINIIKNNNLSSLQIK